MQRLVLVAAILMIGVQQGCERVGSPPLPKSAAQIVQDLDAIEFLKRYRNYVVSPVVRGVDRIYVQFPDGFHFFVADLDTLNNSSLRIVRSPNHSDDFLYRHFTANTETELKHLESAFQVLREFEKHRIISYQVIDGVAKIYTSQPYGDNQNVRLVLLNGLQNFDSARYVITHDLLTVPVHFDGNWSYSVSAKYADYVKD